MKFAKVLSAAAEDMPAEMRQQFLQYKQLKKKIKNIPPVDPSTSGGSHDKLSPAEKEFLAALNKDMDRFNSYFMEKEELAVIKMQAISDAIRNATSKEAAQEQKARLVDFHGEVVLLLHWSLLNYAAVVKILKKHDKHSGLLLRAPYLAKLLHQPFQSTTVMSHLVKRAEELVQDALTNSDDAERGEEDPAEESIPIAGESAPAQAAAQPRQQGSSSGEIPASRINDADAAEAHVQDSEDDETFLTSGLPFELDVPMAKCTKLALQTWEALAKGASTPSTVLTQHQHELNLAKRKASASVDMEGSEARQHHEEPPSKKQEKDASGS